MGLYVFTCESLYSGESPLFAIGCVSTIAYEVTFPSEAGNHRVVTIDSIDQTTNNTIWTITDETCSPSNSTVTTSTLFLKAANLIWRGIYTAL